MDTSSIGLTFEARAVDALSPSLWWGASLKSCPCQFLHSACERPQKPPNGSRASGRQSGRILPCLEFEPPQQLSLHWEHARSGQEHTD
jgi:hypothetical protein